MDWLLSDSIGQLHRRYGERGVLKSNKELNDESKEELSGNIRRYYCSMRKRSTDNEQWRLYKIPCRINYA